MVWKQQKCTCRVKSLAFHSFFALAYYFFRFYILSRFSCSPTATSAASASLTSVLVQSNTIDSSAVQPVCQCCEHRVNEIANRLHSWNKILNECTNNKSSPNTKGLQALYNGIKLYESARNFLVLFCKCADMRSSFYVGEFSNEMKSLYAVSESKVRSSALLPLTDWLDDCAK